MQSGTTPGSSRSSDTEKHERNGDHSKNDADPDMGTLVKRSLHSLKSEPDTVLQKNT